MEAALLQNIVGFYQNAALTVQVGRCWVVLREYSGCGFFTTLAVPDDSPAIVGMDSALGGSDVEAAELSHGAGSILFLKHGRLDFLEVFAFIDGDPATVLDYTLKPMQ